MEQLIELNESEKTQIIGGGFAYDAGFFLREIWIYATNGPNFTGVAAVVGDLTANYDPKY